MRQKLWTGFFTMMTVLFLLPLYLVKALVSFLSYHLSQEMTSKIIKALNKICYSSRMSSTVRKIAMTCLRIDANPRQRPNRIVVLHGVRERIIASKVRLQPMDGGSQGSQGR